MKQTRRIERLQNMIDALEVDREKTIEGSAEDYLIQDAQAMLYLAIERLKDME